MEKYNLVCSSITKAGEPDQHGNQYYWIGFEDNSSGLFGCKTQDLFTIGELAEFYIEKKVGKSGKEYSKIRRVKDIENPYENNQNKIPDSSHGKSKSNIEQINRSVAIKAVCEFRAQSGSVTIDRILEEADRLFDYIQFGINDEPKTGHEKALVTPPSEIPTDELPF